MKTVNASKFNVKGFNDGQIEFIPKGWIIETTNTDHYEIVIVESMKYVRDGEVQFYEKDGTITDRRKSK
jgi:hypothetical protein